MFKEVSEILQLAKTSLKTNRKVVIYNPYDENSVIILTPSMESAIIEDVIQSNVRTGFLHHYKMQALKKGKKYIWEFNPHTCCSMLVEATGCRIIEG